METENCSHLTSQARSIHAMVRIRTFRLHIPFPDSLTDWEIFNLIVSLSKGKVDLLRLAMKDHHYVVWVYPASNPGLREHYTNECQLEIRDTYNISITAKPKSFITTVRHMLEQSYHQDSEKLVITERE